MIEIHGHLYDGKTSAQAPAVCRIYDNGTIRVEHPGTGSPSMVPAAMDSVRFSPRLADTPRYLYFPGGEKFETEDNDAVDRLLRRHRKRSALDLVHLLESKKRYVLLSLGVMILFITATVRYGVPAAAELIAFHLPSNITDIAADQTLSTLDRSFLQPSGLDRATRIRLEKHFAPLLEDHRDYGLRVLFRKGEQVGPNAFALPDGRIIFTDQMVEIAENDDELLSVLAHEAGHVVYRHGMRRIIQGSLLAFAMIAVTGDASGTSELFYGMPVMLTELAYSRQFEREADRYALDVLHARDIPTVHFARLMRRIDRWQKKHHGSRLPGYLSTHPETTDRLRAFEP